MCYLKDGCSSEGKAAGHCEDLNEAGEGIIWQTQIVNETIPFKNDTGHLFCIVIPLKVIVFIMNL